ncbi:MAG: hypothetical protein ABW116_15830 [Candidatus Sedimenticola sp. 20ELBAFRAG]
MNLPRFPVLLSSTLLLLAGHGASLSAAEQYQGYGYGGYGGFRPLTQDERVSQGKNAQRAVPPSPSFVPNQPYTFPDRSAVAYQNSRTPSGIGPQGDMYGSGVPAVSPPPALAAPYRSYGESERGNRNYPPPPNMPRMTPPGIAQQGYKFRRIPGDTENPEQGTTFNRPGNPAYNWRQGTGSGYGRTIAPGPVFRPLEQKSKRGREPSPVPAWAQGSGYSNRDHSPYNPPGFRPGDYR